MPKMAGNEISSDVGQLRGLLLWDLSGCMRTTSQVSVKISTEAGRLTTLPSLSSVYEVAHHLSSISSLRPLVGLLT
jgi:hypothetical protein